MTEEATQPRDPVREQVGEACLRLLAGQVSPRVMARLRGDLLASPEAFPWREINDAIVAEPVEPSRLLERGLRAQRDWILRGGAGRERRRRSLGTRGKTVVAYLLSRAIFFVLYTAAAIAVLVLVKHNWPALDIYALLEWLREALPGLFRAR